MPVSLLERTEGPHDKVCGDFLSGQALARLASLGLVAGQLGAAPITRVRLVHGRTFAEATLPFPAAGLSRRALDEALLRLAAAAGARVSRRQRVRALDPGGAEAVVLATGKHDLPGWARPGSAGGALGFKTYLRLAAPQDAALSSAVELVLLPHGYAGLQRVEGGQANLCVMFGRPTEIGPHLLLDWLAERSPHLRERLDGALPVLPKPIAVARVPYGFIQPPDAGPDWLFRAGDQAGVIPSLAGDGVGLALRSGAFAARAVLAGQAASAHHRCLGRAIRRPIRVAMTAHRIGMSASLQPALVRACRMWPALIRFTAARTRC